MILRNITFQNELLLEEDHAFSMEVYSPRLLGRIVQSFLALENGETPLESFAFFENDEMADASKLLYVVTDPFQIDLNNRKNANLLYNRISSLMNEDVEIKEQWCRTVAQLAQLIDHAICQLPCCVHADGELSVSGYLKETDCQFDDLQGMEPFDRIIALLDFISHFSPHKIVVLCNSNVYLSNSKRAEVLKYACYTKVCLLCVDIAPLPVLDPNEVRWIFHEDFDDEIRKI